MREHAPDELKAPRGFEYSLAAQERIEQWKLDRLVLQYSASKRNLADAQEAARQETVRLETAIDQARLKEGVSVHPPSYQRWLRHVASLSLKAESSEAVVRDLKAKESSLRQALQNQQKKLTAIERHHAQAIEEYRIERARIDYAEADRNWIARLQPDIKSENI